MNKSSQGPAEPTNNQLQKNAIKSPTLVMLRKTDTIFLLTIK